MPQKHAHTDESSSNSDEEELNFNAVRTHTQGTSPPDEEDVIDATFEFYDPQEGDCSTIHSLLQNAEAYTHLHTDLFELAQVISNQGNIGAILKSDSDDSESIVGAFSVLNWDQYIELTHLKNALTHLAKKYSSQDNFRRFENFLEDKKNLFGFVINERFINLPAGLVPQCYETLIDDISWSQTTPEMPPDERPYYFFTHLVFFSTFYEDDKNFNGKRTKSTQNNQTSQRATYRKFEDEEFVQKATWKISWPTHQIVRLNTIHEPTKEATPSEQSMPFSEHRLLYILPYESFKGLTKKLKKLEPFTKGTKIQEIGGF